MDEIQECGDVPAAQQERRGVVGSKLCGEARCVFASLKDTHERWAAMKKLCIAAALCLVFTSVEVIGGIKANSLSILTDAVHFLSDVAAFAISVFSLWAVGWEATPRQSYGFFRIEILGAFVSVLITWFLAGILVYEAIHRLISDTGRVEGSLVFAVSAFGLLINVTMAVLLGHDHGHSHQQGHSGHNEDESDHNEGHSGHNEDESDHTEPQLEEACSEGESGSKGGKKKQRNINVQGAYLHVLGDLIHSVGMMIGGAIMWYKPGWKIIDLLCTILFSVLVVATTLKMIRNIVVVLMESSPRDIDATRVEQGLCEIEEVVAIHELHIWAITMGKVLLSCHVMINRETDSDLVLDKVIHYIRTGYNIAHVTIQIEKE